MARPRLAIQTASCSTDVSTPVPAPGGLSQQGALVGGWSEQQGPISDGPEEGLGIWVMLLRAFVQDPLGQ